MRYEIITTTVVEVYPDGEVEIISQQISKNKILSEGMLTIHNHQINISEKRYGILTFSAKQELAKALPLGSDITVICNNNKYTAHTHSSKKGRIDRLSELMLKENIHVNSVIDARYDIKEKILEILPKSQA